MISIDLKEHLTKLARDERVFSRVLLFAELSIGVENILGDKSKIRLRDWLGENVGDGLAVVRTEKWYKATTEEKKTGAVRPGEGPPPSKFDDLGSFGHRNWRISSIIDVPLWDKAKWWGTGYLHYGPPYPPLLGIMFTDEEFGRQIFSAWRKRFGTFDQNGEIRLSILTGINRADPYAYRVVVGTNPEKLHVDPDKLLVMACRMQTMHPSTSENLEFFLQQKDLARSYGIVPLFGKTQTDMKPAIDLVIGKTDIVVRPAWQVGDHDLDIIALRADDDVIIPEGEKDAPFLKAFERLKRKSKGKS